MINISALISKLTTDELVDIRKEVDNLMTEIDKQIDKKGAGIIEKLSLSVNAYRVIKALKISTLDELSKNITASQFKKTKNVSRTTFEEVSQLLAEYNLKWKPETVYLKESPIRYKKAKPII